MAGAVHTCGPHIALADAVGRTGAILKELFVWPAAAMGGFTHSIHNE